MRIPAGHRGLRSLLGVLPCLYAAGCATPVQKSFTEGVAQAWGRDAVVKLEDGSKVAGELVLVDSASVLLQTEMAVRALELAEVEEIQITTDRFWRAKQPKLAFVLLAFTATATGLALSDDDRSPGTQPFKNAAGGFGIAASALIPISLYTFMRNEVDTQFVSPLGPRDLIDLQRHSRFPFGLPEEQRRRLLQASGGRPGALRDGGKERAP